MKKREDRSRSGSREASPTRSAGPREDILAGSPAVKALLDRRQEAKHPGSTRLAYSRVGYASRVFAYSRVLSRIRAYSAYSRGTRTLGVRVPRVLPRIFARIPRTRGAYSDAPDSRTFRVLSVKWWNEMKMNAHDNGGSLELQDSNGR